MKIRMHKSFFKVPKFVDRLYDKAETKYYNVKYGLQNLWEYRNIIWEDRHWDWLFLIKLLEFKLGKIEEQMVKYGNLKYSKKYAKDVRLAKLLCSRLYESGYYDNAMRNHKQKYGNWYEMKFKKYDNKGEFYTLEEETFLSEAETKRAKADERRWMKHKNYLKNQDKEMLFKIMNKHLFKWWD